ncbi:YneF family protein [Effusibacillus pohliae]|uniref:YneF family protein n=1 Tax=Effusibacillus pohliae TaxID=232270 RepID=UPI000360A9D7|nr:YneF family protein [Effusibacillus pohliae]
MVWLYWVIGVVSFLLGAVAGFYGAVQYLKKQMANMQMSEEEIAAMARSMGRNLNKKQLAQITRQMKNMSAKNFAASNAKKKKK